MKIKTIPKAVGSLHLLLGVVIMKMLIVSVDTPAPLV
tara:strand:- start:434 stop:544 length:111 start_codon:yes stop_codon:yes gene_type:complete